MAEDGPRLQCMRDDLLVALQAADAIVPGNSVKKILGNIRCEVGHDQLVITATDSHINLRALVRRVEVEQVGSVLVPAKQLVSIVRESASATVRLAVVTVKDSQQLEIVLQDGRYFLPIFAGEEFPSVGAFPDSVAGIPVPGDRLERMIRSTQFAVDKDRSSAVLSGVYCAIHEGELLLTATDGKALSEARHRQQVYETMADHAVVIPAQTIHHLDRLLSGCSGEVTLAVDRGLIFIRVVLAGSDEGTPIQIELTSRLVEGVYPTYRNAIPTQAEAAVTFVTEELASAVRRTALLTNNANRGIVMSLEHDRAMFSNFSQSSGTANIPVACTFNGSPTRIGLNAGYLQEVLKVFRRDEITLELNGSGRGMLMRDDQVTFLIMPISLPE